MTHYIVDPSGGGDYRTTDELVSHLETLRGEAVTADIKAGQYLNQYLALKFFGTALNLSFEPNTWMRWTRPVSKNCIHANTNQHVTVTGNGLVIDGYRTGTGNGLSTFSGTLIASDVQVIDCLDGASAHQAGARIELYRVHVFNAHKYAVVHVNGADSVQEDCSFQPADGAAGIAEVLTGIHDFTRCIFRPSPDGTVKRIKASPDVTFTHCDFPDPVEITGGPVMIGCTGSYTLI